MNSDKPVSASEGFKKRLQVVLQEQEYPVTRVALQRAQASLEQNRDDDRSACPHLTMYLPHSLDVTMVSNAKKEPKWRNPVHALHLGKVKAGAGAFLWGDEHERWAVSQVRGLTDMVSEWNDNWDLLHQQEKEENLREARETAKEEDRKKEEELQEHEVGEESAEAKEEAASVEPTPVTSSKEADLASQTVITKDPVTGLADQSEMKVDVKQEETEKSALTAVANNPSTKTSALTEPIMSAALKPNTDASSSGKVDAVPSSAQVVSAPKRSVFSASQPEPISLALGESRFWSLQSKEARICQLRRHLVAKRPVKKKTAPVGSTTKKRKVESKTVQLSSLPAWRDHGPPKPQQLPLKEESSWEDQQRHAEETVEEWRSHFRRSRERYWAEKSVKQVSFFGQLSEDEDAHGRAVCILCSKKEQSFALCSSTRDAFRGDDLMQCLECNFVGCVPTEAGAQTSEHMTRHFVETNHSFAVTCGKRGAIYCFHCKEFINHESFQLEKERIDLKHTIPWLGWKEHPLIRSFDPFRFADIADHGIFWRGMYAAYPPIVLAAHVRGARSCWWRQRVFTGDLLDLPGNTEPCIKEFCRAQRLRDTKEELSAPIGMFNLGNTCFQSAVLQCIIASAPIRQFLLTDVKHNHVSCRELRKLDEQLKSSVKAAGTKSTVASSDVCLACELDKFVLCYIGRAQGITLLAAVGANGAGKKVDDMAEKPGQPIVAADMLACSWKCGGMNHLAGYDQRDAHEFFHGFLDAVCKSDRDYRRRVHRAVDFSGAKFDSSQYQGLAKSLFEGSFRSVLICQVCGNKRSQRESFTTISLPLSKEVSRMSLSSDPSDRKLSLRRCLRHFTQPETLSDPVDCVHCGKKTLTKKQQVIAKLPRVLCLHLKRFDAAQNKKIEEFVSFPKTMNTGAFLPHWSEVGLANEQETSNSGEDTEPTVLYSLYATVNHFGNLQSGHYVSNVKLNGKWFHCNDAHVSANTSENVLASQGAYMLFYSR